MIVALAGRRIDATDAREIRFPIESVEKVRQELRELLRSTRPAAIVCSGANGADLVALEVAGEIGIPRTMVLPFDPVVFKSVSVTDRPGNWEDLFNRICKEIKKEGQLIILNFAVDDKDAYEKTSIAILNQAQILAEKYASKEITGVIIWEGSVKEKEDVTNHFIREGIKRGLLIKEIKTLIKYDNSSATS